MPTPLEEFKFLIARYHPRHEWATFTPGWTPMALPVLYAFVHHFVSDPTPYSVQMMRDHERQAMNAQRDLIAGPYHVLVSGDAHAGEFRPLHVRGGATAGWNTNSVAICFDANSEIHDVPEGNVKMGAAVLALGMIFGTVARDVLVTRPHSAVYPTACPGWRLRSVAHDGYLGIGALARVYYEAAAGAPTPPIVLPPAPPPPAPPAGNPGDLDALARAIAEVKRRCSQNPLHRGHGGTRPVETKFVQARLHSVGVDLGPSGVDGVFGGFTDRGVRGWQYGAGLKVDGIVGKRTINSMYP